ncbi:MAG TPA: methionyl-tRNA formyltransferase [Candidatus Colwellbacteria bacterium]|nr:methionyl-tRNA formyltransferase [Candidatus Colwellbacteria bacterium]
MNNFVFFGTPEFAAIILKNLVKAGFVPKAVVANLDKPIGRKRVITPPPAKQIVLDSGKNIKILQPEKITPEFLETLKSIPADFYLVAAYAKILPQELIDIPRLGVVGVHPSLLPELRGASPIQSAILEGKTRTGVSLFLIDALMDHGPVLRQKTIPIDPDDNSETLTEKLAELSSKMLVEILPDIIDGKITPEIQDETKATFTEKFKTESAFIEEKDLISAKSGNTELAKKIHNKIRAFYPEPGAWTILNGKRVKLLKSKINETGKLKLEIIQIEGEKPKATDIF